jgi:hypothetical protein
MTKVILDQATLANLHGLREHLEVCDEKGFTLGYIQPVPSRDRALYEGVEIPFSAEELNRREQETESYTTAEVLAYLEKL